MLDGGWSDEDPRGASVGGRDADGVAVDGPASAVAILSAACRSVCRLRARLYAIPRVFSRKIKRVRARQTDHTSL